MIPYEALPGLHPLFQARMNDNDAGLFPAPVWDTAYWRNRVKAVQDRTYQRSALTSALQALNENLGGDGLVAANIQRLKNPDTAAVVTGQQVGVFTGPLYTIYKALSTIRLAHWMQETWGAPVVPVFWLETGDHDLKEISSVGLLNEAGELVTLASDPVPDSRLPVSELRLDTTVTDLLTRFAATLPESPFKPAVLEELGAAYQAGGSYGAAFGSMLHRLFRGTGLVLLDPSAPDIRRLCSPLFRDLIAQRTALRTALLEQTHAVAEAGYTPQVTVVPDSCQMFYASGGGRVRIDDGSRGFHLGTETVSEETLATQIEHTPERFSPAVLTRPLVQDYLLPTAAYVAGPSELAYHAQLPAAYALFKLPAPAVIPRISATLVEPPVRRLLDKLPLTVQQVLCEPDGGLSHLLRSVAGGALDAPRREIHERLEQLITPLLEAARSIDPTLEQAALNAGGKMRYQVENLETKLVKALERREETLVRQVQRCRHALAPSGGLQERVLNIFPFIARHGYGLMDRLRNDLDPFAPGHQVVDL